MCKQINYSKYQKRAIKFLYDFLGSEIPFTYERTQTNHLKVLIEGVSKPLFTGSTPSDCKSINNFMAEVKREVKASQDEDENETPKASLFITLPIKQSHDRLIQSCVKSLRSRLFIIKSKEEEQVLSAKTVDVVADYRQALIKHTLSQGIQSRRQGSYIKPKEMKHLETKIASHLNFMMPTLAHYADLLGSKDKYQDKIPESHIATDIDTPLPPPPVIIDDQENDNSPIIEQADESTSQIPKSTSINELMGMAESHRVSVLRQLTKSQSLQLIDDINQAMALNREEDIEAVIAMIKEKDLPLEAIIARLES